MPYYTKSKKIQRFVDQENDKKRRQFQASIWQHLGKYVLISYKDETYTSVGKLEKIEQDKDSNMKITLRTYRAKHEKAYLSEFTTGEDGKISPRNWV